MTGIGGDRFQTIVKDGMVGMAVAGGAVVDFGGLVGLGLGLAGREMKKK